MGLYAKRREPDAPAVTAEQLRQALANSTTGDEFDALMGWHRAHGAGWDERPSPEQRA